MPVKLPPAPATPIPVSIQSPIDSDVIDDRSNRSLLGKVAGILQKTITDLANLVNLANLDHVGLLGLLAATPTDHNPSEHHLHHEYSLESALKLHLLPQLRSVPMSETPSAANTIVFLPRHATFSPDCIPRAKVKETKHVSLEYDPKTRRKVLNTYEIIREIGRGEHGKVKLARDLVHDELVAIKIVSRKLKHDRRLRMRRPSNAPPNYRTKSDYETKIRREIAIMKRCDHKYIVKLREVLDDLSLFKIYLVLEHMERGEIKWKRQYPIEVPRPLDPLDGDKSNQSSGNKIPCLTGNKRSSIIGLGTASEDNDLLSNEFSPNLTFRQSRRIFRDVLLGLEYLHLQGIVHRDIKPANLLVSSDYTVKISDFGVSFASLLGSSDDGEYFNDMELAKTVGTPAFFAPELCQTTSLLVPQSAAVSSTNLQDDDKSFSTGGRKTSDVSAIPKVDHKIDIWAFGVTLYCLLFGRVPFNADNEFALFDVIVNEPLEFPPSIAAFHSPQEVTDEEFELAKDLISKMLQKDSRQRIDIDEIKQHPFALMDLENDLEKLHELFFLNEEYIDQTRAFNDNGYFSLEPTPEELGRSVVGIGRRIRSDLLRALTTSDTDTAKRLALRIEHSASLTSSSGSSSRVGMLTYEDDDRSHTILLLEAMSCLQSRETNISSIPHHMSPQAHFLRSKSPTVYQTDDTAAVPLAALPKVPQLNISTAGMPAPYLNQPLSNVSPLILQPNIFSGQITSPTNQLLLSSIQTPHRRQSLALQSLLLQDVFESDSSIRRDSIGSTEAPQIETKRNVGGDLYLKNQSALETFKDIQKSDQRRRNSSLFLSLSRSSSLSAGRKNSRVLEDLSFAHAKTSPSDLEEECTEKKTESKIKIGPIGIEGNRRTSLVISLPLTERFASLDSDNDDFLNRKYHEFRKSKKERAHEDVAEDPDVVELSYSKQDTIGQIGDKLKNFNLMSLMSKKKNGTSGPGFDNYQSKAECSFQMADPKSKAIKQDVFPSLSPSCLSSGELVSSVSSSSSGRSSESDEEEGNLTLKFSSKLGTSGRPPYFTLANRALSHDSSLPELGHKPSPAASHMHYEVPFMFQSNMLEFEDVPEGLMGKAQEGLSEVLAPTSVEQTKKIVSPSIATSDSSKRSNLHNRATSDATGSVFTASEPNAKDGDLPLRFSKKQTTHSSPLRWEIGRLEESQPVERPSTTRIDERDPLAEKTQVPVTPGYFNNHYKKERNAAPFPFAKHLQGEICSTPRDKDRPSYLRSNSVTVAILQNNRSQLNEQQNEQVVEQQNESNCKN